VADGPVSIGEGELLVFHRPPRLLCQVMRRSLSLVMSLLLATAFGCGDDAGSHDGGADANVTADARDPLNAVRLRQSLAGAMWANPNIYPVVPIQVTVFGTAVSVTVEVDGVVVEATDPENDNLWTAPVSIAGLDLGTPYTVTATGTSLYNNTVKHEATLTLRTGGLQLTDFAQVGAAATPRVHVVNNELWVTWADRRDTEREVWLTRMDGSGAALPGYEAPVCIVCDADETLYGRVAAGDASLGVLYQKSGGPYINWFKLVDGDGNNITAPIPLDPAGWNGSFGGDVHFDGEHFIVVWRINDGAGAGEIRWMRVHGSTGDVTGPIVVAASGNGSPIGGFAPFTFVKATSIIDRTYISFLRDRFDSALALDIPRAQLATVDRDGNVLRTDYAEPEDLWSFNYDSRVHQINGGALLMWGAQDLTASDPIPTTFRAARIDAQGGIDPERVNGTIMVTAPDHRVEPTFVSHNVFLGSLAWLDERSYAGPSGLIELYTAPVLDDLTTDTPTVVPHARFIEGTSQLNGVLAGTNVVLVWLDERNGNGIGDSRPEVRLETIWY